MYNNLTEIEVLIIYNFFTPIFLDILFVFFFRTALTIEATSTVDESLVT